MGNGDSKVLPQPNREAPLQNEGQLGPPKVRGPIYECARSVYVYGFIPHALIVVIANGSEVIGHDRPYVGYGDIALTRPLVVGDRITATQEAFGIRSVQSYGPVTVERQPGSLDRPTVGRVLFACGQIVNVSNLSPSTHVEVYSAATRPVAITPANLIGTAECTGASVSAETQPLKEGWFVVTRQISCPGTSHEVDSPVSTSVKVPAEPHPVVPPTLSPPPHPPGNDVVDLAGLYVGSAVEVTDATAHAVVGGGLATNDRTWTHVQPPVQAGHGYNAAQRLCTASGPGPTVVPTNDTGNPVLLSPICPDDREVTVANTTINATVVLYRVGSALPIGFGGAAPGEIPISIGPGYLPLGVGATLYVRQYFGGGAISPPSNHVPVAECRNVITQHNDNRRTGAYLHEQALTPATVGGPTFGRLYERDVDGSPFAQILYVRGVRRTLRGTKNLFIVATSTNMVFAFDADDETPGGGAGLVWKTPAPLGPTRVLNGNEICRETWGTVGVTSTPVIDVTSQTIYVVARHWTQTGPPTPPGSARMDGDHYLHALKLNDGTPRLPARKIEGHDPVTGLDFQAFCQRNRPGLLLLNGVVYVGFATFSCDGGPYRGWVFGYRANDLSPAAIFCTSKDARGSGVWQSGNGLLGTEDGSVYFATGNDMNDTDERPGHAPPPARLADSFVRLRVVPAWPGLQEAGRFQPGNALRLRDGDRDAAGNPIAGRWGDTDLGAGGPVGLPDQRLIGGGKQGRYYVLDAQTMSLTQDTTSPAMRKIGQGFQAFVNNDRDVAADAAANYEIYGAAEGFGPNIHGGPCYWRGPSYIYQMSEKDYMKAFHYDRLTGIVHQTPVRVASVRPGPGMPGGHSSLSANGDVDGIVWTSIPTNDGQGLPTPGSLVAFEALTLKEIWADHMPEWFAKFNPPTIADGRVFRPVFEHIGVPDPDDGRAPTVLRGGKVIVYGLRKARPGHDPRLDWRTWRSGRDPEPRFSMQEIWERLGGSGALTTPTTDTIELGDGRGGRRRDYSGSVNPRRARVSVRQPLEQVTFHRPSRELVNVSASVFWSESTGAHFVLGGIRDEYLRQGAHESPLGYPISNERNTADGEGRVSHFERGDIVWTAPGGAEMRRHEF